MPNFLGSSSLFSKEFARPISKSQLPGASASAISEGMEKLKVLHQQVLPFILRREKEQVLRELPPKIFSVINAQMSPIQSNLYQSFCSNSSIRGSLMKLQKAIQDGETNESGVSIGSDVLKSLLFLRLLCTHPSLAITSAESCATNDAAWFSASSSGKLLALLELLRAIGIGNDSLVAADNDTSLLYCEEEEDGVDAYGKLMESAVDSGLTLSLQTQAVTKSKCIIFGQFHQSLDAVEEFVFKPYFRSLRYLRLDSRCPVDRRTQIAASFNNDPNIQVLLSTARVGGLGLNLTGADTVIFLENDYNPFVDLQASDRVHRIGQRKVVNVYNIITQGSIEEKIMNLQRKKVQISEAIVNTENSTLFSLGTDRLLDVFSFRSNLESTVNEGLTEQEFDLDALAERFKDEYESLSVEDFIQRFATA